MGTKESLGGMKLSEKVS